jgi:hypothetical protein
MQQMLAQYKQQFPGGQPAPTLPPASPVGYEGAQPGINMQGTPSSGSAATSGTAKLIAALMKAQQQKQIQNQLNNSQQVQGPAQGSIPAMYPGADPSTSSPGTLANPQGF